MTITKPEKFVGLHAHSMFSAYDGLGAVSSHIDFVQSNEMNAFCLTDHGNMNGFSTGWKHYESLKKKGHNIKFIPGIEAYVHPSLSDWAKLKEQIAKEKEEAKNNSVDIDEEETTITIEDESASKKTFNPLNRRHHLVILPKNSQGLKDLFKLTSFGYTNGFYRFPRIDHKAIREINKGKNLIASSACLAGQPSWEMFQECQDIPWNDITYQIVKERKDKIIPRLRNMIDQYVETFGIENYFLELQFNKLSPQNAINYLLMELSKETGVQLICSADSHFYSPEKWKAREMYKRIRPGNWTNDEEFPKSVEDLKCELYPKNASQMWEEYLKSKQNGNDFYDDEIIKNAIEKTYDIVWDEIGEIEPDKKVKYPSFVVPKDKSAFDALKEMAFEGLKKKGLENNQEYIDRLNKELEVIKKKDFEIYFLTIKDIIDTLSQHMLVGAGRGSSCGSILCYLLNITKIDSIKHGLIFERFLTEIRVDNPDVDSDVSNKDLAYKILQEKYGEDNIVAISNINTLGFKSLVKDLACKFFNIDYQEVNDAVKNVEFEIKRGCKSDQVDFNNKMINLEYAKKYSLKFMEFIKKYSELEEFIVELSGQQKSIGRHAGGILVADNIPDQMPIILSKKTRQTPWDKKYLEDFGWIKFDLLALETLRIVEECIKLILQNHFMIKNPTFDQINEWYERYLNPDIIDLNDQKVYDYVYRQKNYAGIFQCTNKDTQKLFSEFGPKTLNDISDLTALYRPGPMDVGAHWKYVKRKKGEEEITYNHPLEIEFLESTVGLMCYQEQMMKMVNKMGGLSLPDTETFRKVVSKKPVPGDPLYEDMLKYKEQLINGITEKGVDRKIATNIWDSIEAFAGYAFNKCLHEDTLVETKERGYVKIKDVIVGEHVNSKNGFVKILNKFKNGRKRLKKVYINEKFLILSEDHKIETSDGMKAIKKINQIIDKIICK